MPQSPQIRSTPWCQNDFHSVGIRVFTPQGTNPEKMDKVGFIFTNLISDTANHEFAGRAGHAPSDDTYVLINHFHNINT